MHLAGREHGGHRRLDERQGDQARIHARGIAANPLLRTTRAADAERAHIRASQRGKRINEGGQAGRPDRELAETLGGRQMKLGKARPDHEISPSVMN
jgi:hypothetical protein